MKRFLIVLIIILIVPFFSYADEYGEYLNSFDLSSFELLDDETADTLEYFGINDFDYNSINNLSFKKTAEYLIEQINSGLPSAFMTLSVILAIILISSVFESFVTDDSLKETLGSMTNIVLCIYIITRLSICLDLCCKTINICADFIYAFFPAFCIIAATGGALASSFSVNTTLLILAQGVSFVSNSVFLPIIQCFLCIGICSSLSANISFGSMIVGLKNVITKAISLTSGIFVSILSVKTAIASRADAIGIRSMRFAINSVVPVIGGSISEGLLSIQAYSSLIKTSVGIVGIIAVVLTFLPALIEVVLWRLSIGAAVIISDLTGQTNPSRLLSAIEDTLTLITVVMILIMVTTIISIGILVAARAV
jgi:stage III sporulation protein AE